MGNKISPKIFFDLSEHRDLNCFLSHFDMIDGICTEKSLSISSKCLAIINNLINYMNDTSVKLISGIHFDQNDNILNEIDKLKLHCNYIRHLEVVNSSSESVEEWVELNNIRHLSSLSLEHIPIKSVLHLKLHRSSLLRLSLHNSIENLESVINLCGGDQSFSDKWMTLLHLDIRYNNLKTIDDSVLYLTSLTVMDISRNAIDDLAFVKKIPTLVCLNASFNNVKSLPKAVNTRLKILILAYNYLRDIDGISSFKFLVTLNISYNMIATNHCLNQLKEMDFLKDLVLRGNPLYNSTNYRKLVLDMVSPQVSVNFAIDRKVLSENENKYLRKTKVIFIAPPAESPTNVNRSVPKIIIHENDSSDSASNTPNNPRRRPYRPKIGIRSLSGTSISGRDMEGSLNEQIRHHRERQIESLSGSVISNYPSLTLRSSVFQPSLTCKDDSCVNIPNYIGAKTSKIFIATSNKVLKACPSVSIQIFEHKLMAVDEFDAAVDNIDLWTLMAATTDAFFETSDAGNVLKLVFFVSVDKEHENLLILSTRTIEFSEVAELKIFSKELNYYLQSFSVSYTDWTSLPLTNVSLCCTKCHSKVIIVNKNPRPYLCNKCFGAAFILESTVSSSITTNQLVPRERANSGLITRSKMTPLKNSTSHLVIQVISPSVSLSRENGNCEDSSCKTMGINKSVVDEHKDLLSRNLMDSSVVNIDCEIINSNILGLDLNTMEHDCNEVNVAYGLIKSALQNAWVLHEPFYDIRFYLHSRSKIDDRLKLYLLTKVIVDHEDLLFVSKVYFGYRSTGMAVAALLVISNLRAIFYNLLDVESSNLEECIKFLYEFPLATLQQLEYCLNNQWIELQFKSKPIVSLLVGDRECVKLIGIAISEAISLRTTNFSIIFSKEISQLKSPHLLSELTDESFEDVSMESLYKSESYLIRNATKFPTTERSSLEYDPKMVIIESKHIFFVTMSYSAKSPLPTFDLLHSVSMFVVHNQMIIDSRDDCLLRLIVNEDADKGFVDIRFMSPQSRSKAALTIARFWKDLYRVDMLYITEDLFVD